MQITSRHLTATGTLALAVIASGAIAASAAAPVKITDCDHASTRPKALILTCGDANSALTGLRWSSFGGTSATGKGTLVVNTCEPNCAAGNGRRFAVAVTATGPRTCKRGLRVYGKLTLRYTSRPPSSSLGILTRWRLGCPT
jgi:hypothetical protein